MKRIKYKFLSAEINSGTEKEPTVDRVFLEKSMTWSEANEEIAKREAYNGEVTVEEVEDPIIEPTQLDRVEAQVTYTALMTDTLLEEV